MQGINSWRGHQVNVGQCGIFPRRPHQLHFQWIGFACVLPHHSPQHSTCTLSSGFTKDLTIVLVLYCDPQTQTPFDAKVVQFTNWPFLSHPASLSNSERTQTLLHNLPGMGMYVCCMAFCLSSLSASLSLSLYMSICISLPRSLTLSQ